jgi:hypothetical protein
MRRYDLFCCKWNERKANGLDSLGSHRPDETSWHGACFYHPRLEKTTNPGTEGLLPRGRSSSVICQVPRPKAQPPWALGSTPPEPPLSPDLPEFPSRPHPSTPRSPRSSFPREERLFLYRKLKSDNCRLTISNWKNSLSAHQACAKRAADSGILAICNCQLLIANLPTATRSLRGGLVLPPRRTPPSKRPRSAASPAQASGPDNAPR